LNAKFSTYSFEELKFGWIEGSWDIRCLVIRSIPIHLEKAASNGGFAGTNITIDDRDPLALFDGVSRLGQGSPVL
jgi:hypothetical protein